MNRERLGFALIVAFTYFGVLIVGIVEEPPEKAFELIKEAMFAVGPLMGFIANDIFRKER